jgi:hypothetical protein
LVGWRVSIAKSEEKKEKKNSPKFSVFSHEYAKLIKIIVFLIWFQEKID